MAIKNSESRGHSAGERAVRACLEARGFWSDTVREKALPVYSASERRIVRTRVDFYVATLGLIIEFDGAQHFRESSGVFSGHSLEMQRRRDLDIDAEARRLGVHLLRIPYRSLRDVDKIINDAIAWIFENPGKILTPVYEYYESQES